MILLRLRQTEYSKFAREWKAGKGWSSLTRWNEGYSDQRKMEMEGCGENEREATVYVWLGRERQRGRKLRSLYLIYTVLSLLTAAVACVEGPERADNVFLIQVVVVELWSHR